MKAITLLLIGLVLFLAAIFLPRALDPTNTAIVWIRLLRVPAGDAANGYPLCHDIFHD